MERIKARPPDGEQGPSDWMLRRGRRAAFRRRVEAVMHQDFMMLELQLVEFFLLFRSQFRGDLPLRILHRASHSLRGLDADRFEFRGGRIDNRCDPGCLFGRQIQRTPQVLSHSVAHLAGMWRPQKMASHVQCAQQAARRHAGDEDEKESERQLPFQRVVHCENSV